MKIASPLRKHFVALYRGFLVGTFSAYVVLWISILLDLHRRPLTMQEFIVYPPALFSYLALMPIITQLLRRSSFFLVVLTLSAILWLWLVMAICDRLRDNNGNQAVVNAPAGRTTYTWDYENRMSAAQLPSSVRNTFLYDGDGKRVRKEDSSGISKFIWDEQNILLETNESDITQAIYTLEPAQFGNLISQNRSGTARFYHFDGLGSTSRLTNASQSVTDSFLYEAFGSIRTSSGSTTNPFLYVGRQGYIFDPDLAQYSLRARIYRPDLGRFSSVEPLALPTPGLVWSLANLGFGQIITPMPGTWYEYAQNNPLFFVDPSGWWAASPATSPGLVPPPGGIGIIVRPPAPTPPPGGLGVGGIIGATVTRVIIPIALICVGVGYFSATAAFKACAEAAGQAAVACAARACRRFKKKEQGRVQCALRYFDRFGGQCYSNLYGKLFTCGISSLDMDFSCQPNPCRNLCCSDDTCYCCVVYPGEKKATLVFPKKITESQCSSVAEGIIGSDLWWCDTTPDCSNPISPN